jgi:hypothetical protein
MKHKQLCTLRCSAHHWSGIPEAGQGHKRRSQRGDGRRRLGAPVGCGPGSGDRTEAQATARKRRRGVLGTSCRRRLGHQCPMAGSQARRTSSGPRGTSCPRDKVLTAEDQGHVEMLLRSPLHFFVYLMISLGLQ